ncbi:Glycine betaine/carnitine/choline transport ATP-binding protein OpuCA [Paraliobacillus sp. PM-2]|uniref:betaine/proline/choline family ABC transporter ATP-binding protein n=1 Tax=Paraliobacillus sp. PM-2 TaxID=1462524 RepID=UPI00061C9FDA|nr:betaine/proline/choline family ABC transporter ATP-binding protein [Paraliobacillus sp. PM-2]CQR46262.1 Glycine betaine/carnitine/choline transport ATP-binding protein OpuCA [Paraliobacillus sp. PM-2]
MIELKKVSKVYEDGFQALKEIDLIFEEGAINVLIGPSGCGKTTLMKLLNRLTEYTDGEILIDGKNIKEIDPIKLRRTMGYVIQSIGLFPHMTIFNNVATVPRLLKWNKSKINKKVEELLNMVDLEPKTFKKRYPSELSGGQQQRIGVIRALAAEPSIILMDEPFSALDPISKEQLQDELIRLQKEIKKTIVFVTHDMDEAIKIANQIILMREGTIVQKGSPQDILENPANDFVKDFIGSDRLDQVLPPLSELADMNYPFVSSKTSVNEAINKMIEKNITQIPVVDDKETFIGVVSLYKALANKDGILTEIVDQSTTVSENTDINDVIKEVRETQSIIPIISNDKKLTGVLGGNQLLEALHKFYESKSGVA